VTRRTSWIGLPVALLVLVAAAEDAPSVSVTVKPSVANVGDAIELIVTVDVPAGTRLEPEPLGPEIGPFSVLDGRWEAPAEGETVRRFWRGSIAAYEVGEVELPAIAVRYVDAEGGSSRASSEPVPVTIESVLGPDDADQAPLADLKAPASLRGDFSVLWIAGIAFAAVVLAALLVWWLVRRYGARFAAVPASTDPFQREAPDVWAYGELRKLLDERLAEEGRVEEFYTRLAWILKRYLSGRFRVDLMEHTTSELRQLLAQAGVGAEPAALAHAMLERSDHVKFARHLPAAERCRAEVEEAYGIVDATRPRATTQEAAQEGAA
jgi:hypothetical protein